MFVWSAVLHKKSARALVRHHRLQPGGVSILAILARVRSSKLKLHAAKAGGVSANYWLVVVATS